MSVALATRELATTATTRYLEVGAFVKPEDSIASHKGHAKRISEKLGCTMAIEASSVSICTAEGEQMFRMLVDDHIQ